MKELITEVVKKLVDDETKVIVKEVKGESTTIFEITVAKEDLGKVIGKEGRNANAIRTIVKAAAKKYKQKYVINIL